MRRPSGTAPPVVAGPDTGPGSVTTVVVTRDRRGRLSRALPRHDGPVVLVDPGSADGVAARNLGVGAARTPYVTFVEDDSWWEPGALDLASVYLDAYERLGLIAATVLVGTDTPSDPVSALMARSSSREPDLPSRSVLSFTAGGAVLRRDAFLEAGGFVHPGGEERLARDLVMAGWGVVHLPEVVAHRHCEGAGRRTSTRPVRDG